MAPRGKNTKTAPPRQRAWTWLAKQARAQIRFLIALGVGLAVGFTVPIDETVPRILAGWNVGGWLYLLLVGIKMWRAEVDGIRREAGIERGSRIAVLIAVTLGSLFTLACAARTNCRVEERARARPNHKCGVLDLHHLAFLAPHPYGVLALLRA
jgi:hypothetical protein